MDTDLYDEFGNYIGPDLLSDEEVDEDAESIQEDAKSDEDVDMDHAVVGVGEEPTEESLAVSFVTHRSMLLVKLRSILF
ncbi:unnamed protein product [Echinostoma caproni]|uniref:EFTUD2 domain-containing protein n=1 Tax=Echinostoma caproni TaxID=27848 RepID=A0A183BHB1_9TREM|nr:unnamed protein product [Echinostoma caproni]